MIRCPGCTEKYLSNLIFCPECGFCPPEIDGIPAWAPELAFAGGGFKSEYFNTLSELEAENFWFRARNALIIWALKKYAPSFQSFIEIGCGTGFVLSGIASIFQSAKLFGSEIFSNGLEFAARRVQKVQFMQMDARSIPYENEFDAIGAFDVLEHISEDERVLAETYRALKSGGILLLTVPQHRWLWSATDDYACHVRRYTAVELHSKLKQAGFTLLRSTSFVSLLLPMMLLSRRRHQNKKDFDPLKEFRISPVLNRILEVFLRLEHRMIQSGISLPMGGSRLVVASK
jgi:ubiquinone/menaquinone biosynthesis C-methylase UbiE